MNKRAFPSAAGIMFIITLASLLLSALVTNLYLAIGISESIILISAILISRKIGRSDGIGVLRLNRIGLRAVVLSVLIGICATVLLQELSKYLFTFAALPETQLALLEKTVAVNSTGEFLLKALFLAVIPAVCEEFSFRGIIIRISSRPWLAVLISSLLFTLIHMYHIVLGIQLFLLATLLGTMVIISDSIYPAIIVHICHNFLNLLFSTLCRHFSLDWLEPGRNLPLPVIAAVFAIFGLCGWCFIYRVNRQPVSRI